ncbi:glutamate formimidoyltransferase [Anaerosalibacter bizertensis]|uniref:glutamate formimidoyltransferase n=1 Tax=Anaerosalibacter bizertensis TaxID=932217 RepID=A0A9Q4AE90_9FIRM|nr:glutamate formimidoyltransferase [Anaerosalibacter bizertensis]MBV1820618.1 glutamate formimidoyltransferase [Bacteroidales bacterium MSK.15.36]MCB5560590.1 glutamate formimidoyltransferase [Anaerosalibacter bizertensis]MCG4566036.1 glutamate formimidoyltransferase [Anaerosalibacter bizertensis]MCG4583448.1 glutamate formimidoyltransferase [Anaerosalibacter bizertensis]MCG4585190.1 glutamate formimidoyltransferase [Anaerosalibacter bizertensis]
MARILQCVPNFSEGRNKEVIEAIVDEVRKVDEVKLLDYSSDKDHNRTVVTFIGEPERVLEAAFNACKKASELIDMTKHIGEHPRMGATDVIPLIPISDITEEYAIEMSKKLGKRIGEELNIPVYLYEKSASAPHRENLAKIRKGQYEGMAEKLKEEEWAPDFGPNELNIKAGVTAVGARMPLVAFNVNLDTDDLSIAKKISKAVRGSSGGFAYCKALGIEIKERNIVQVSMNMVDYTKTPLYRVFDMIEREANRYGVNVIGSEIIGLVPMNALIDCTNYYLKVEDFDESQILEKRIFE